MQLTARLSHCWNALDDNHPRLSSCDQDKLLCKPSATTTEILWYSGTQEPQRWPNIALATLSSRENAGATCAFFSLPRLASSFFESRAWECDYVGFLPTKALRITTKASIGSHHTARDGFSPFGQTLVQLLMIWHLIRQRKNTSQKLNDANLSNYAVTWKFSHHHWPDTAGEIEHRWGIQKETICITTQPASPISRVIK